MGNGSPETLSSVVTLMTSPGPAGWVSGTASFGSTGGTLPFLPLLQCGLSRLFLAEPFSEEEPWIRVERHTGLPREMIHGTEVREWFRETEPHLLQDERLSLWSEQRMSDVFRALPRGNVFVILVQEIPGTRVTGSELGLQTWDPGLQGLDSGTEVLDPNPGGLGIQEDVLEDIGSELL